MKRSFTIIELLIFMGIFGSFLAILTQIFQSALDVQLETSASSGVELPANYLLYRLEYDVRRAASITTPASPGQSASTLVLVIAGDTHTYSLAGSTLQVVNSQGAISLTDSAVLVSDFSVTRRGSGTGNDALTISMDLTSATQTTSGAAANKSVSTTISLR